MDGCSQAHARPPWSQDPAPPLVLLEGQHSSPASSASSPPPLIDRTSSKSRRALLPNRLAPLPHQLRLTGARGQGMAWPPSSFLLRRLDPAPYVRFVPAVPPESPASPDPIAAFRVAAALPDGQRTAPASTLVPPRCPDRARGARPVQPRVDRAGQLRGLPAAPRPSTPALCFLSTDGPRPMVASLVSFGFILEL
ncbi:lysine-rich arabinogalactan protein 19-like [Triticum dicoccoides]|uniref:lysine-rich arabinogalactan protein 19-like n=1 Tax=Triticum dicoccoides TaxID=85692 RepID=UPI00188F4A88|nr:lysine-rich arabinogalactan protein 19-like [Triticum dicoccoides]